MKTTFETEEEIKFLYDLLWRGVMSSESVLFNPAYDSCSAYVGIIKKFRKKCFEYLETKDPNEQVLEKINES